MRHQIRWTAQRIARHLDLIAPLIHRRREYLPPFRYKVLPDPLIPPPLTEDTSRWDVLKPYDYWARPYTDFILRSHFRAPDGWESGPGPLALHLPLGERGSFSHPEALLYVDGTAVAAADRRHQTITLPAALADGARHQIALHGWSGDSNRDGPQARLMLRPCALVQIDEPTRDFVAAARVALDAAETLNADHPARGRLLNALEAAFIELDLRQWQPDGPLGGPDFYASVPPAYQVLREGIVAAGPPLDVTIAAAGHAHLDLAWLWTLGQARRKAGRSLYTVIHLMEEFPDYKFTQSQPQLYDYLRRDYPDLFAAIKEKVAEGRWEPIGGMWVEADCNLSGGEALVRQFLLGRTFFREHFGPEAESPVLWLPDVFGYAWALPQLIKKAGMDYFMTIKIGWSQYNRLPYDSFWWQGLDGTRVLTHFSPAPDYNSPEFASTYNAHTAPRDALGTWRNFQQKELQTDLLMAFGYGDGGGGPNREMLENIGELAHFPGMPQMRHAKAIDFFRRMEVESGERLPTWNGELYLELHRGTFTTQARNKQANRRAEFALHDAEFLASLALILDDDFVYPSDDLREAWRLVCLNQFHDIIPGSSITAVYQESLAQYAEIEKLTTAAREEALTAIARRVPGDLLLVNPTPFPRRDLVHWPEALAAGQRVVTAQGASLPVQTTGQGVWMQPDTLSPYSVTPLWLSDDDSYSESDIRKKDTSLQVTPSCLENKFLRVELNEAGDLVRIYDKRAEREVSPPGAIANHFQAFPDRPLNWDAWDIEIYYDEKMWTSDPAASVMVEEEGPLRATLEIRRRILHSDYVQRVSLDAGSPQLNFETDIDWRERRVLLKVAFPVQILSPTATFEIQWGNVERPTHRNTSWDWARFETCAHKWVDLSEGGYGVSLLNDCKYGHDVRDNVLRLSLLRGAGSPDPEADSGRHCFRYTLLPHQGGWEAGTIPAAYALNDPSFLVKGRGGGRKTAVSPPAASFLAVDREQVIIETVKRAEDGNGLIIRLYESRRWRGAFTLTAGFPLRAAALTNLLEKGEEEVAVNEDGRSLTLSITPYEILTLRLFPLTP